MCVKIKWTQKANGDNKLYKVFCKYFIGLNIELKKDIKETLSVLGIQQIQNYQFQFHPPELFVKLIFYFYSKHSMLVFYLFFNLTQLIFSIQLNPSRADKNWLICLLFNPVTNVCKRCWFYAFVSIHQPIFNNTHMFTIYVFKSAVFFLILILYNFSAMLSAH